VSRLVDKDGVEVKVGDVVLNFRRQPVKVLGWRTTHEGSTGRVEVQDMITGTASEYYPGVINCTIVEVEA
jgi:hypothetical protein